MKFGIKTLMLALALSASTSVFAADLKVAVIDMRVILSKSPQAQAATQKLQGEFKAREEKIVSLEKALKEKMEKMQRNSAIMSETEKNKFEKDVIASQRELQRLQTEFREDAAARQQEETKKLIDGVNLAVNAIAQKDKYDLIIHREAMSYASTQIDITDKVIAAIAATGA